MIFLSEDKKQGSFLKRSVRKKFLIILFLFSNISISSELIHTEFSSNINEKNTSFYDLKNKNFSKIISELSRKNYKSLNEDEMFNLAEANFRMKDYGISLDLFRKFVFLKNDSVNESKAQIRIVEISYLLGLPDEILEKALFRIQELNSSRALVAYSKILNVYINISKEHHKDLNHALNQVVIPEKYSKLLGFKRFVRAKVFFENKKYKELISYLNLINPAQIENVSILKSYFSSALSSILKDKIQNKNFIGVVKFYNENKKSNYILDTHAKDLSALLRKKVRAI